ncbi:MAG: adenosylmethionine decarboxylase [Patescibacteria group bacterium]|nr:adenosylmethionine decarboxylase [Patescibacteria group bacterium]
MICENKPTGLHILGKIYTKKVDLLNDSSKIQKNIAEIIKKNKLEDLHSYYYNFPQEGFTGIICLSESHIALHTWPEYNCVTLDVFICNYSRDNTQTCRHIFDSIVNLFEPYKVFKVEKKR